MIRRYNKQKEQQRFYKTNDRIGAPTLRVLDPEGKQIGVLSRFEALQKAKELELDLVEIAPAAKPPVAKIIDFKKFLYQQEKKKKEEKKHAKSSETKEVRLGPFMEDHDLNVMIRRAEEFLKDNNKVRLVLKFRGRQIVHPEFGQEVMKKVIGALSTISRAEREPHLEGKQLISLLVPGKKKDEKENKEISQQEV